MSIELPRDAEGREIPLDTATLYDEDGNVQKIIRYDYLVFQTVPSSKWNVITLDHVIHCASNMHLTPPDSWEKLLEDLGMVEDYVDTSALNGPACIYMHNADKSCNTCKLYGGTPCVSKMCADIADRIRKLRGEDE